MPERIGPSESISQAVERLIPQLTTLLEERGVALEEGEQNRLTQKLLAYITRRRAEDFDLPTIADAITDVLGSGEQARERWFQRAGIAHTIAVHVEANKQRAAALRTEIGYTTPTITEYVTEDGNFYLANLFTREHFKQETAVLEHCLGGTSIDSYFERVEEGDLEILSLRATKDLPEYGVKEHQPVMTVEYNRHTNEVSQVKIGAEHTVLEHNTPFLRQALEALYYLRQGSKVAGIEPRKVRAYADLERLAAYSDEFDSSDEILLKDGRVLTHDDIEDADSHEFLCDIIAGAVIITPNISLSTLEAMPLEAVALDDLSKATPEQLAIIISRIVENRESLAAAIAAEELVFNTEERNRLAEVVTRPSDAHLLIEATYAQGPDLPKLVDLSGENIRHLVQILLDDWEGASKEWMVLLSSQILIAHADVITDEQHEQMLAKSLATADVDISSAISIVQRLASMIPSEKLEQYLEDLRNTDNARVALLSLRDIPDQFTTEEIDMLIGTIENMFDNIEPEAVPEGVSLIKHFVRNDLIGSKADWFTDEQIRRLYAVDQQYRHRENIQWLRER